MVISVRGNADILGKSSGQQP